MGLFFLRVSPIPRANPTPSAPLRLRWLERLLQDPQRTAAEEFPFHTAHRTTLAFTGFEMNLAIDQRLPFNSQSSVSAFSVLGLADVHRRHHSPIPTCLQFSLTVFTESSTPSTALATVDRVRDTKDRRAICKASNGASQSP